MKILLNTVDVLPRRKMESKSIRLTSLLLAFNYDAPGQTGLFFSFKTSFFSSMFTSHNASNSRVPEVSKIVL